MRRPQWLCFVVGALLVASSELPAQRLDAARVGVMRDAIPMQGHAITVALSGDGSPASRVGDAKFRPVGALVGAAAGAVYGLLVYAVTADGRPNLLRYSDHRLPKAVAVGAVAGLVVDVARYVYARRSSEESETAMTTSR